MAELSITSKLGERVMTAGGIEAVVSGRTYAKGTELADIEAGSATVESVIATQDGRHAVIDGWHDGEEAEAIYFERVAIAGVWAHGWIDSASRRLVQIG